LSVLNWYEWFTVSIADMGRRPDVRGKVDGADWEGIGCAGNEKTGFGGGE
jgi:hypothetical protein